MNSELRLIPSKVRDRYWIDSHAPTGEWSPSSGKWLLFIAVNRIDTSWNVIDLETRSGRLGISAKVATAKPNPLAENSRFRLICIYTYDCTDIEDVQRVRSRLRELGFVKKIPYKTDSATREGKYAKHGDKRIALFFE